MAQNTGVLIPVKNKDHKFGEAADYIVQWATDGYDRFPLAFTPHEIETARERALKNMEDIPTEQTEHCHNWLCEIFAWMRNPFGK